MYTLDFQRAKLKRTISVSKATRQAQQQLLLHGLQRAAARGKQSHSLKLLLKTVLYKYKEITVLKVLLSRVSPANIFCFEGDYTSVMNKITLELQPRFTPLIASICSLQVCSFNGCSLPPKKLVYGSRNMQNLKEFYHRTEF